jgi:hypothetical protein
VLRQRHAEEQHEPQRQAAPALTVPTAADIALATDPSTLEAVRTQIKRSVDAGALDVDEAVALEEQIDAQLANLLDGLP